MKQRLKTTLIYVFGVGFLMLGVLGLVLPVLQGILFIVIGLGLLSLRWDWLHRQKLRLLARYPSVARRYNAVVRRITRIGVKCGIL